MSINLISRYSVFIDILWWWQLFSIFEGKSHKASNAIFLTQKIIGNGKCDYPFSFQIFRLKTLWNRNECPTKQKYRYFIQWTLATVQFSSKPQQIGFGHRREISQSFKCNNSHTKDYWQRPLWSPFFISNF